MILTTEIRRYSPGLSQPPHRHATASVTLVLRGALRERAKRDDVSAAPLSLVVKPEGTVHADLFGTSRVVTCQITLAPSVHDDPRWGPVLSRWRWIFGGPAIRAAVALARDIATGEGAETLNESATAVIETLDARDAASPPSWLPRAIEYLDAEVARGAQHIRVTDAASSARVHPVHLTRVFQRWYGCTVSAWIRRRRAQRVAEHVARDDDTLSRIASTVGFADQSHMNRTFRRDTGVLPAHYRELLRSL